MENAPFIYGYYFAAIGLIAAVALLLFAKITESIEQKEGGFYGNSLLFYVYFYSLSFSEREIL